MKTVSSASKDKDKALEQVLNDIEKQLLHIWNPQRLSDMYGDNMSTPTILLKTG